VFECRVDFEIEHGQKINNVKSEISKNRVQENYFDQQTNPQCQVPACVSQQRNTANTATHHQPITNCTPHSLISHQSTKLHGTRSIQ
jgi:hypothetical protein